jgi:hypothetical protein
VNLRLNMSAGEFFDLVRPAALLFSAVISTWVLASARKRFPFYQSLLWALGTLFFPLIILPLYFVTLFLKKRKIATTTNEGYSASSANPVKWRFTWPLLYAFIVFFSIGLYLYRDSESVDAHLARAVQARLDGNRDRTVREYKLALAVEDDPHTHKLLAIELADIGFWTDAVSEFRVALEGGEADDSIHFRLGSLLEQLNHKGEASLEYEAFLNTAVCTREPIDPRCEEARSKSR